MLLENRTGFLSFAQLDCEHFTVLTLGFHSLGNKWHVSFVHSDDTQLAKEKIDLFMLVSLLTYKECLESEMWQEDMKVVLEIMIVWQAIRHSDSVITPAGKMHVWLSQNELSEVMLGSG